MRKLHHIKVETDEEESKYLLERFQEDREMLWGIGCEDRLGFVIYCIEPEKEFQVRSWLHEAQQDYFMRHRRKHKYENMTRLERVAAGLEQDPYKKHNMLMSDKLGTHYSPEQRDYSRAVGIEYYSGMSRLQKVEGIPQKEETVVGCQDMYGDEDGV